MSCSRSNGGSFTQYKDNDISSSHLPCPWYKCPRQQVKKEKQRKLPRKLFKNEEKDVTGNYLEDSSKFFLDLLNRRNSQKKKKNFQCVNRCPAYKYEKTSYKTVVIEPPHEHFTSASTNESFNTTGLCLSAAATGEYGINAHFYSNNPQLRKTLEIEILDTVLSQVFRDAENQTSISVADFGVNTESTGRPESECAKKVRRESKRKDSGHGAKSDPSKFTRESVSSGQQTTCSSVESPCKVDAGQQTEVASFGHKDFTHGSVDAGFRKKSASSQKPSSGESEIFTETYTLEGPSTEEPTTTCSCPDISEEEYKQMPEFNKFSCKRCDRAVVKSQAYFSVPLMQCHVATILCSIIFFYFFKYFSITYF